MIAGTPPLAYNFPRAIAEDVMLRQDTLRFISSSSSSFAMSNPRKTYLNRSVSLRSDYF